MFTFWGHYQRIACRVSFRSVPPHCLSPFLRLQWYSLIADARCCLLRHLFSSCSSSLLLLSLWCPFSSTTATSVGCVCVCVCVMGGSGYLRVEVLSRSLLLLAIFCFSGDLVPLFCRCFSATLALPGFRCSSLDGIQREMAKSAQTKSKDDTFCARTSHETLFSYLYWWLAFVCRVLLFGSSNEKRTVCLFVWVGVCLCWGKKRETETC